MAFVLLTLVRQATLHQSRLLNQRLGCSPQAAMALAYWSLTGEWWRPPLESAP